MTKVEGLGVLLFSERIEPVQYNFETTGTGGYGRVNGKFDLNDALEETDVALQLDTGKTIPIRLRDAHPVTRSRFDIVTDGSPLKPVTE